MEISDYDAGGGSGFGDDDGGGDDDGDDGDGGDGGSGNGDHSGGFCDDDDDGGGDDGDGVDGGSGNGDHNGGFCDGDDNGVGVCKSFEVKCSVLGQLEAWLKPGLIIFHPELCTEPGHSYHTFRFQMIFHPKPSHSKYNITNTFFALSL